MRMRAVRPARTRRSPEPVFAQDGCCAQQRLCSVIPRTSSPFPVQATVLRIAMMRSGLREQGSASRMLMTVNGTRLARLVLGLSLVTRRISMHSSCCQLDWLYASGCEGGVAAAKSIM